MKKTVIITYCEDHAQAESFVDEFQSIIQNTDTVTMDDETVRVELNTDDVYYAKELLKEFMSNTGEDKAVLVLDGRHYEEEAHQSFFYIITYDHVEG